MRYAMLVLLVACSGTTTGTDAHPVGSGHGTCVARKGTYSSIYAVRSGDCGDVPEQVYQVDQTAVAGDAGPSACTATVTESVDNCEVTYATRCKNASGSFAVTGLAKWSQDGTYGTAVEETTVFGAAGNVLCDGTYGLTIHRE